MVLLYVPPVDEAQACCWIKPEVNTVYGTVLQTNSFHVHMTLDKNPREIFNRMFLSDTHQIIKSITSIVEVKILSLKLSNEFQGVVICSTVIGGIIILSSSMLLTV